MKIGLWSDCHNFPSLPLMKLSAYHKSLGDSVSHYMPLEHYDIRDKFEDAIIATSVSNYAQMYQDVRESNAATYRYNGYRWIECNRTTHSQIFDYMHNAMSRGEISQCTIKSRR